MAMLSPSPVLKFVDEKGFDEKIITDIAYDYHGRRLATVSADAVIRIRDLDDNGVWCVEDGCEIKSAHQVRNPASHLFYIDGNSRRSPLRDTNYKCL